MVSTDGGISSPTINNNATSRATQASITTSSTATTPTPNVPSIPIKRKSSSLFAKLSSPLSALTNLRPPRAARKLISEFYIRLNEPHREYAPGDLVRGSVIVTTEKDVRVTHLVVNLVGRVDLYGAATYNVGKKRNVNYTGPTEFEGGLILCRDQQVLWGEGRLDAGVYEFGFVMELAGKGLPSSLDFEKGSISYNISATLTRPTTISPTRVCHHKLSLVEIIDIASFPKPKPRVIPIECGSKRRIKSSHGPGSSDEKGALKSGPKHPSLSNLTTPNSSNPHISIDAASINTITQNSAKKNGTACATIDLIRAGCLRGESIPLKISITHTKAIKSLHGIIVTLVRQGRFDTFPISTNSGTTKSSSPSSLKKGLSLTFGGSLTTFRKDLSQVIMPLIVDPHTLTTVVKTSVRVPEDAFPTISTVPGQIVSFKYFVEVLVDLGGKLAAKQDDFLNGVGMVNIPAAATELGGKDAGMLGAGDTSGMMAVYGAKVVETDRIRREVRKVVSCRFEVIVGTTDSASGKGRRRKNALTDEATSGADKRRNHGPHYPHPGYNPVRTITADDTVLLDNNSAPYNPPSPVQASLPPPISTPIPASPLPPSLDSGVDLISVMPPPPPPPPDMSHLDEKIRLRMAEQALLPSAPPGFAGEASGSSSLVTAAPSPVLIEMDSTPAPMYEPPHAASAPPLEMVQGEGQYMDVDHHPTGYFNYSHHPPHPHPHQCHHHHYHHDLSYPQQPGRAVPESAAAATEDKLELERRRLLASASVPPIPQLLPLPQLPLEGSSSRVVVGADAGGDTGTGEDPQLVPRPSAPALGTGDDVDVMDGELPRYER